MAKHKKETIDGYNFLLEQSEVSLPPRKSGGVSKKGKRWGAKSATENFTPIKVIVKPEHPTKLKALLALISRLKGKVLGYYHQ